MSPLITSVLTIGLAISCTPKGSGETGRVGSETGVVTELYNVSSHGEWISVGAGDIHSCGITVDSSIECWGCSNQDPVDGLDGRRCSPPDGAFDELSLYGEYNCARDGSDFVCWIDRYIENIVPPIPETETIAVAAGRWGICLVNDENEAGC